jgi:hypothetical protein
MGDPNGPVLRRADVLETLNRHGVEFLLVGGQAGIVYGAQRPTTDLGLVLRWSPENLNRMGEVLVEFNAGIRVEGIAEGYPMPHRDGAFLGTMEISLGWPCHSIPGRAGRLGGRRQPSHRVRRPAENR